MMRLLAQADAARLPLADASVDLVFTSPPYIDARTYGINAQRHCAEWIDWMLGVVRECTRVCRGLVLVNVAGVTRNWCYQPGPEGLLYQWWKAGGIAWRPAYWRRVGIPGSGGKQWLRSDVEHVLAFVGNRGQIPWANNTANGHPPKWGPGGEMSHRLSSGSRVNQWGKNGSPKGMGNRREAGGADNAARPSHVTTQGPFGNRPSNGGRRANGNPKPAYMDGGRSRKIMTRPREGMHNQEQDWMPPVLANPGNLVKIIVGGGVMGHPLAHENEAPFPVPLPAWFIRSHCPPDGIVLDPFMGSGSTGQAAEQEGRRFIGFDLRMNQCELARRRLETPHVAKRKARTAVLATGGAE